MKKIRSEQGPALRLTDLQPGDGGEVAFVRAEDEGILNKFKAIGVLPGQVIRLVRRTPTFLFAMGESQFAIDAFLARHIFLRGVTAGEIS